MRLAYSALLTTLALTVSALPSPKDTTLLAKRFVPGYCGVHVTQFQKGEGNGDQSQYRLTIVIKDGVGGVIGGVATAVARSGEAVQVTSELPNKFLATVENVDSDTISFAYAGQNFYSKSGQCKFGGYDNGSRNGDCGFSCPA